MDIFDTNYIARRKLKSPIVSVGLYSLTRVEFNYLSVKIFL